MKILIFYTFNFYHEYEENLLMLKISLHTLFKNLIINSKNTFFDVIIYTETKKELDKRLNFPVRIVEINKKEYMDKFRIVSVASYEKKGLVKFNFIGHSRVFIFQELFEKNEYDLFFYLDNDVFIVPEHGDEVTKGLKKIEAPMAYFSENINLQSWLLMIINNTPEIKLTVDLIDDNKYSKYNSSQVINNGVIIFPNNTFSRKISSDMLHTYKDLIEVLGNNYGNDQTALTIAFNMNNLRSNVVQNDKNLKWIYHLIYDKLTHYPSFREYFVTIAIKNLPIDINTENNYVKCPDYFYSGDKSGSVSKFTGYVAYSILESFLFLPEKIFHPNLSNPNENDNNMRYQTRLTNRSQSVSVEYLYYPNMDFIETISDDNNFNYDGYSLNCDNTIDASVNTRGIYKKIDLSDENKKLVPLYTNKINGIYINFRSLQIYFNYAISRVIHIIYPSDCLILDYETKFNNFFIKCDQIGLKIKKYTVDELQKKYSSDQMSIMRSMRPKNFYEMKMVFGLKILYIEGGILLDHDKVINDRYLSNESLLGLILSHKFFNNYKCEDYVDGHNHCGPQTNIIGSVSENETLLQLMNIQWNFPSSVENMFSPIISSTSSISNQGNWIYPMDIVDIIDTTS